MTISTGSAPPSSAPSPSAGQEVPGREAYAASSARTPPGGCDFATHDNYAELLGTTRQG